MSEVDITNLFEDIFPINGTDPSLFICSKASV